MGLRTEAGFDLKLLFIIHSQLCKSPIAEALPQGAGV